MSFAAIFLIIVLVTALVLGWIALWMTAMIVRLIFNVVKTPFRVARRMDHAIARSRFARPARQHRIDDVRCLDRRCGARLPAEAKFCARCGGALPRKIAQLHAHPVEVPQHGYTQVA